MRYRRLDASGDYTIGQGNANFLVDSPDCVGQSILTRLRLWVGEWFLDVTEGTPWTTEILSALLYNTKPLLDMAIRTRVLLTDGVLSIVSYESTIDPETRQLTVNMTVATRYGQAVIAETL